jgi:hypothetical protein
VSKGYTAGVVVSTASGLCPAGLGAWLLWRDSPAEAAFEHFLKVGIKSVRFVLRKAKGKEILLQS